MIKEQFNPGDFHSIIPNINNNIYDGNAPYINYIDYNNKSHEKIMSDLPSKLNNFDELFGYKYKEKKHLNTITEELGKIKDSDNNYRFKYFLCNGSFEWMDSRLLYYFMNVLKPNKIIEIGSGNSTLLMVNAKKVLNLKTKIICIDKNPHSTIKKLNENSSITLFEEQLINIDTKLFETLTKNDILFIDSSHAIKMNSDVMFYFGKIFPILNSGVHIQIHDIFLPYEYPLGWINNGIFWNEQYMLYIFLQNSSKFKVVFSNNYAKYKFGTVLLDIQTNFYENKVLIDREKYIEPFAGGSIWLKVN